MDIYSELAEKVVEELHDAGSYAQMALNNRADHPELARVLHDISLEEMEHFNRLHEAVVKMVGDIKRKQNEFGG